MASLFNFFVAEVTESLYPAGITNTKGSNCELDSCKVDRDITRVNSCVL